MKGMVRIRDRIKAGKEHEVWELTKNEWKLTLDFPRHGAIEKKSIDQNMRSVSTIV